MDSCTLRYYVWWLWNRANQRKQVGCVFEANWAIEQLCPFQQDRNYHFVDKKPLFIYFQVQVYNMLWHRLVWEMHAGHCSCPFENGYWADFLQATQTAGCMFISANNFFKRKRVLSSEEAHIFLEMLAGSHPKKSMLGFQNPKQKQQREVDSSSAGCPLSTFLPSIHKNKPWTWTSNLLSWKCHAKQSPWQVRVLSCRGQYCVERMQIYHYL